MTRITVSVVIPVYNGEPYVLETLESVVSQSYRDIEILVVDDGSIDKTAAIAKSIDDPRIIYFYQSNSGVSRARNFGLLQANGSYIVFLDADDIIPARFIEDRVSILISHQLDCLTGPVLLFGDEIVNSRQLRGCSSNGAKEILLSYCAVTTAPSAYFFRLDFLRQHCLSFNETLSSTADREFLLRCLAIGTFVFFDSVSPLYYRVSPNSMSRLKSPSLLMDLKLFFERLPHLTSLLNIQDPSLVSTAKSIIALDIASISLTLGFRRESLFYTLIAIKFNPKYSLMQLIKIFLSKSKNVPIESFGILSF